MSAQHSPGPWFTVSSEWTKNAKGPYIEVRNEAMGTIGFSPICLVRGDKRLVTPNVMAANARLIASAPDLLEALLTARDHIDMDALEVSHCKDAQRIREAIAKATGQKGGA